MTKVLPLVYGSTYNKRITAFYVEVYKKRFGEYPKINFMPYYCMLKRVFTKYGEMKVCASILVHFEQNGEKIMAEKFPIMWLEKSIPRYLQYLQEFYDIDIDSDEKLYDSVKSRLEYLAIPLSL